MNNSKKFEELNPYKFNSLEKVFGGVYERQFCEPTADEWFTDEDPFTYEGDPHAVYATRTTGLFGGDCSDTNSDDKRGTCDRSRRSMDNCATDDVAL